MAFLGVIRDFQPRCLRGGRGRHSVLTVPLARDYLITSILEWLSDVGCGDVCVLPAFEPNAAYREWIQRHARHASVRVLGPEERTDPFLDGEPSDSVIFLDPRYCALHPFDLKPFIAAHTEQMTAVFASASNREAHGLLEHVITDSAGNVRKVQRVFDRWRWSQSPGGVVPCCVVPLSLAANGVTFPLSAFRRRLAVRGVPLRDHPSPGVHLDLERTDDLLQLACGELAAHDANAPSSVSRPRQTELTVAGTAKVAPTARLVGRIVIHEDALIGDRATIVGPAVIGRRATIGPEATVAHAVVLDGATVSPGAGVMRCLYDGDDEAMEELIRHDLADQHPLDDRANPFVVTRDGEPESDVDAWITRRAPSAKRLFDVVVSAMGLLLLSPLLLAVALLVKLTSRGPLFFIHHREGLNGQEFGCIKFRTMLADAHTLQRALAEQNECDGKQFVIRHDPRVTWLGGLLRKSNVDELPQLWNVLLGQMSLVGPRPSPYRENQVCAPWRYARLSVRPGITGLWQICRHDRDQGDFHQWVHYDVAYVRHMSFPLDLKIIAYTFWSLGGRRPVAMEKLILVERQESQALGPVRAGLSPWPMPTAAGNANRSH